MNELSKGSEEKEVNWWALIELWMSKVEGTPLPKEITMKRRLAHAVRTTPADGKTMTDWLREVNEKLKTTREKSKMKVATLRRYDQNTEKKMSDCAKENCCHDIAWAVVHPQNAICLGIFQRKENAEDFRRQQACAYVVVRVAIIPLYKDFVESLNKHADTLS